MLNPPELVLIIVALAILLIWGPSKLPSLAKAIGQAIYEFKRGTRGLLEEEEKKNQQQMTEQERERILELARKLGISVEGKSLTQVLEEIKAKLEQQSSK